MKYITTDTHPVLKEGIIFDNYLDIACVCEIGHDNYTYKIKPSLDKGYIKEVEEKEYTTSDMIKFVGAITNVHYTKKQGDMLLHNFKEQRNKK